MNRIVAAVTVAAALVVGVLVVPAQAASPSYVALGDSYASGVGSRTYYDASGSCYRSPYAYPEKVAAQIGADLTFKACSGATVADVRSNQLGTLSSSTSRVTVQVGGNDIGFTSVITKCAEVWVSCSNAVDDAEQTMRDVLPSRLDALYTDIRSRAPYAQVVVVGYPRLFDGDTCGGTAGVSSKEESLINGAANLLASVVSGRASAHGFSYVDPRAAFSSHEVCSSSEWINGLSWPIKESFHPSRSGQASGYTPLVAAELG